MERERNGFVPSGDNQNSSPENELTPQSSPRSDDVAIEATPNPTWLIQDVEPDWAPDFELFTID